MKRFLFLPLVLFASFPASALSPEAQEFMEISKQLEPLQCEKRKLRRAIALAEAEHREGDARELRSKFRKLDTDPKTSRMEHRLGALERRISGDKGGTRDPEDLDAISRQRVEAFYRCD